MPMPYRDSKRKAYKTSRIERERCEKLANRVEKKPTRLRSLRETAGPMPQFIGNCRRQGTPKNSGQDSGNLRRPAAKAARPLFSGDATFADAFSSDADAPKADFCAARIELEANSES